MLRTGSGGRGLVCERGRSQNEPWQDGSVGKSACVRTDDLSWVPEPMRWKARPDFLRLSSDPHLGTGHVCARPTPPTEIRSM